MVGLIAVAFQAVVTCFFADMPFTKFSRFCYDFFQLSNPPSSPSERREPVTSCGTSRRRSSWVTRHSQAKVRCGNHLDFPARSLAGKPAPPGFQKQCKFFKIWWTRGDSNPRPHHCERGKQIHKTRCCNHLRLLNITSNGQLGQPR